jgi:MoxR-like ATPase
MPSEEAREAMRSLQELVRSSIVGQERIVERLVIGLLANGNLLIEGLPGLAKTRAVKSLARNLAADFSRIQFTPDLLPSDVTGTEVVHTTSSGPEFRFEPGPIFANIVLADEINRSPAKVQAALLEAMEERQVTVAGTTHAMPDLFMVMATQNPIEQEGTYPLPEAQMDRFLMHLYIDYGSEEAEGEIVGLVRNEERAKLATGSLGSEGKAPSSAVSGTAAPEPVQQASVFEARRAIAEVSVSDVVMRYLVDLVFATRYPERYSEDLRRWIQVGASPRGALALDKCARTRAWLAGRDHVIPDDVRDVAPDCLRHRLTLSYEASADGVSASDVVDELLKQVAVA